MCPAQSCRFAYALPVNFPIKFKPTKEEESSAQIWSSARRNIQESCRKKENKINNAKNEPSRSVKLLVQFLNSFPRVVCIKLPAREFFRFFSFIVLVSRMFHTHY